VILFREFEFCPADLLAMCRGTVCERSAREGLGDAPSVAEVRIRCRIGSGIGSTCGPIRGWVRRRQVAGRVIGHQSIRRRS
jgi:hypothetical protein